MLAIALGSCSALAVGTPAATPPRPLGPGERWLPVANWVVDGVHLLCAGTGLVGGFFVHGSPLDPRSAWMTIPDGSRRELAWPVGYSARFVPGLEVLDDTGRVIAREGSTVGGGCETPEHDVWSVDFRSDPPP
jgi:hypothetical protein